MSKESGALVIASSARLGQLASLAHLYSPAIRLDINNIPHLHPLLHQLFINHRIQLELFRPLCCLEAKDDVGDGFAVPAQRVEGFGGEEVGYFAFVDFFDFFYAEA